MLLEVLQLFILALLSQINKKKTLNHIQIINNTIDHIQRLKIKFTENDIRKFLFSTRFLFQNLDRVIYLIVSISWLEIQTHWILTQGHLLKN